MQNTSYDNDNVFRKIISSIIPAHKFYQSDKFIVIKDKYPQAPYHYLIIPTGCYVNFHDFITQSSTSEWIELKNILNDMLNSCPESKIIINSGSFASQEIYHLHIHVQSPKPLFKEK